MIMDTTKICELHNQRLEVGEVPIEYGLIALLPEYVEAMERLFPNSRSSVFGGCCVDLDKLSEETTFCSACRAAEREWELEFEKRNP